MESRKDSVVSLYKTRREEHFFSLDFMFMYIKNKKTTASFKQSLQGAVEGRERYDWGKGRRQPQHSAGHSRLICSCQYEGFPSSCPYLCCPPGRQCRTERLCESHLSTVSCCSTQVAAALLCNPVIMSIKWLKKEVEGGESKFCLSKEKKNAGTHNFLRTIMKHCNK